MTPADVLAAARDLLERPAPAGAGGWQRAVALLSRQALEQALEDFAAGTQLDFMGPDPKGASR